MKTQNTFQTRLTYAYYYNKSKIVNICKHLKYDSNVRMAIVFDLSMLLYTFSIIIQMNTSTHIHLR